MHNVHSRGNIAPLVVILGANRINNQDTIIAICVLVLFVAHMLDFTARWKHDPHLPVPKVGLELATLRLVT